MDLLYLSIAQLLFTGKVEFDHLQVWPPSSPREVTTVGT